MKSVKIKISPVELEEIHVLFSSPFKPNPWKKKETVSATIAAYFYRECIPKTVTKIGNKINNKVIQQKKNLTLTYIEALVFYEFATAVEQSGLGSPLMRVLVERIKSQIHQEVIV